MKKITFTKTLALLVFLGLSSSLFYCNKKNDKEDIKITSINNLGQKIKVTNTIDDINNTGTIVWEGKDTENLLILEAFLLEIITSPETIRTYYFNGNLVISNNVNAIKFTTAKETTRTFKLEKKKTEVVVPVNRGIKLVTFTFKAPFNMTNTIDEANETGVIIWDGGTMGASPSVVGNPATVTTIPTFQNENIKNHVSHYSKGRKIINGLFDEIRFTIGDLTSSFKVQKKQ